MNPLKAEPIEALSDATQLERLFEITKDILVAENLDAALFSIAAGVHDLFGFRYVTMVAAEDTDQDLRRRVLFGYDQAVVTERLNERIERKEVARLMKMSTRFFDDCYFCPAEDEIKWERSIYTGTLPNAVQRDFPNQWHERDALMLTLHDRQGTMIGYMSVDGPSNGLIPDSQTLRAMQVFVNLMGLSLSNARYQNRLEYEATHDGLTNLPNRQVFSTTLLHALEGVRKTRKRSAAVLFIDLDEFKAINDSLGHLAGDHVLIEAANRLRTVAGEGNLVARLGGDEFAVLVQGLKRMGDLDQIIENIQLSLRQPHIVQGRPLYTTASIGVAPLKPDYARIEDVLRDADTAMYHAKALGRARSAYFTEELHLDAARRLALRTDLRMAIDEEQYMLHYQPIVALADGSIAGFEALLRWNHPRSGMVFPAEFLPLAEEMGLMVPIGRYVLKAAFKQYKEWKLQFPERTLQLNVNLSVQEIMQHDLADYTADLMREMAIDPKQIVVEITESSILHTERSARAALRRLHEIGVKLCIDDFGTGYSSLRYVQEFPIDSYKIDQSFIIGSSSRASNAPLVDMLLRLAESYDLSVIAEGIETQAHLDMLKMLGCRHGQGYFFYQPLTVSEAFSALSKA